MVTEMVSSAYHGSPAFPGPHGSSEEFVDGLTKAGCCKARRCGVFHLDIERPSPGVKI